MSFGWYHSAVTAVIDSYYSYNINLKTFNFLLLAKKQSLTNGTTYLVKDFSLFAIFPSTKFWSSYIAWLYIKRTKLHTKGGPIHPSLTLLCKNFTHFAAKYIFSHFPISLTKSFIDNNTTHILQHTIIHYPSFSHSIILKLHHFCCPKHISISFFISHTKSPFFESNITHNTNNLMYSLYLTFILSISHFHIFYKCISHKNTPLLIYL